jgi:hypothetical protein
MRRKNSTLIDADFNADFRGDQEDHSENQRLHQR